MYSARTRSIILKNAAGRKNVCALRPAMSLLQNIATEGLASCLASPQSTNNLLGSTLDFDLSY